MMISYLAQSATTESHLRSYSKGLHVHVAAF